VRKTKRSIFLYRRKSFFAIIFLFLSFAFLYNQSIKNYLIDQADHYYKIGEYQKSLNVLNKANNIFGNDSIFKASILERLGLIYWNNGNLEESLNFYKQALFIASELKLSKEIVNIQGIINIHDLYNKGKQFRQIGKYQESIDSFKLAINIAKQINNVEHEIKCLRQLGAVYYLLDDKINYLKLISESFNKAVRINLIREEGYSAFNLGVYYWSIDDYSKALHYFNIAYEISPRYGNKEDQSESLMSIGIVYRDMGLYDKALEYLQSALRIDNQLENHNQIINDLNNIGITLRKRGYINNSISDYNLSLSNYSQALGLAIKIGDKLNESRILNNIGSLLTYLNRYDAAIEYLKIAYEKAKAINDFEIMSISLNNLGIVNTNLGNYGESIKYYRDSISIAQKLNRGQTLWEAYFEMGNSYKKQKYNDLALKYYKISISIIEDIRAKINQEDYKASYLGTDKRLNVYQSLIDLLISLNKGSANSQFNYDAFYYLERAKARSLLDSLEVSNVDIDKEINFKLLNKENDILNDISHLYLNLFNEDLSISQIKTLNDNLIIKEEQYDELKREIRTTSPSYAELKFPKIILFKESQILLPNSHSAFIAYCLGTTKGYAFAVTKKGLKLFDIPSSQQLQKKVADYLRSLTDKDNLNFDINHELYDILVSPGLDKNIKTIIICPDGILNFLPFEALKCSDAKDDWLINRYSISYTPSLSSLRELISRKRRKASGLSKYIFLVGDPDYGDHEVDPILQSNSLEGFYNGTPLKLGRLEHSRLELTKISALFDKRKTLSLYRQEANEQLIKNQNLNGYKIIHFAAHTLIDDKNPGRSSIILALNQNSEEDGFLQMREIFNLKMNADLVTLSACETGLGQLIHGEGIVGLNRAFFFAGANAVLMSLWAVHDEASSQLMERFYFHLKKGRSISDALRSAKIEMINSKNLSHPFYWAGFIVTGNANKVIFPNKSTTWILLIIFIFGVITVSLAVLNKKRKFSKIARSESLLSQP
jgi:CHAT domain-containing protein/Tfp pilus assembly protein PilF